MARLRFPGRPGYRFGRHGIRYGADEVKNIKDPSLAIVAYIHQGLRQFRELFGESDEECDFEGFFPRDYKKNERRLSAILASQTVQSQQDAAETSGAVGTRLAKAKDSIAALPASERTRGRMKIVIRQSYKHLITSGLAKPTKSHVISSVKQLELMKSGTRPPEKRKIIRIKISHKKGSFPTSQKHKIIKPSLSPSETESVKSVKKRGRPRKVPLPETIANKFREAQKPEKADKKVVKQLILKAKCRAGKFKTKVPKVPKAKQPKDKVTKPVKVSPSKIFSPQGSKLPMHAKKFVLPVMSSRSSRIIIPNKRFLQDDGFSSALLAKKPKSDSFSSPSERKKVKLSSPKISNSDSSFSSVVKSKVKAKIQNSVRVDDTPGRVLSTQHVVTSDSKKKGIKHVVKITTKKVESSGTESIAISDDEDSKSLFPRSPLSPSKLEVFNRAGPMSLPGYNRQRFDSAAHKSRDFLRKAKLQLNRTTLNRSKAALARSLKAKMKREAKVEEQREKMRQFSPSSPTSPLRLSPIITARSLTDSQLSPSRVFDSAQCLSPEQTFGQGGSLKLGTASGSKVSKQLAFEAKCAICGDPNLVARNGLYYGIPSCYGCSQFYRKEVGYGMRFVCKKSGNCEVVKETKRKCPACWFRRCERFYPSADKMKQSSPEKNRKVLPPSKMTPLALDLSDHDNHKPHAFSPSSATFGVSTPTRSPGSGFSPKYTSTASGPGVSSVKGSPGISTSTNLSPSFMPSPETTPDKSPRSQRGDFRGPRIKHVCRRAAMVLKKPVAKFPSPPSLRLSALPSLEKEKIFRADRDARANESSDDDRPMEDIIKSAKSDDVVIIHRKTKKTPKCIVQATKYQQIGKRKLRCRTCDGCKKPECGKCVYCRDKTKNGGPNLIKQACVDRRCLKPIYKKAATNLFVMKNLKDSDAASDEVDNNQNVPVPKNSEGIPSNSNTSQVACYLGGREAQQGEVTEIAPHKADGNSFEYVKQSCLEVPKRAPRVREKVVATLQQAIVQPVLNVNRKVVPTPGVLKDMHVIKADFKEDNSLFFSWAYGMALTMMKPSCVRTVCFLCGSAGKHELIFCMACCEPFHLFCLSEEERPDEDNMENWCCRRCQFCNVCGHQNNLLQCDRCQSTYHPECLGPNYPTKPSRKKNIWVCMKCVRCKSCGATTPGNGNSAIWMYDFSLCYECGQLMDKGNFCPICHKCYSDDDWESKMIECANCKSWVHAKCEELSDEMYQVLSDLPEDVHYTCKLCSTERPAHWEIMLNEAFYGGLKSVLLGLLGMKCSHHLINIDPNKEKKLHENKKKLSPKSKPSENIHKQNTRSKGHSEKSTPENSPSSKTKLTVTDDGRVAIETNNGSSVAKSSTQSDENCKEPRNIFKTIAMETGFTPLDVSLNVSGGEEKTETVDETTAICDIADRAECEGDLFKSQTESTKETSANQFTNYSNCLNGSTVESTNQMCSGDEITNKNFPNDEQSSENVEKCKNESGLKKTCNIVSTNEKLSITEPANEKRLPDNSKMDAVPLSSTTKSESTNENNSFSDVEMADSSLSEEIGEKDDFLSTCDLIPPIFRSGGTPDSQISMKVRYDPTENVSDLFEDSPEKSLIPKLDSLDTTSEDLSVVSDSKTDNSDGKTDNKSETSDNKSETSDSKTENSDSKTDNSDSKSEISDSKTENSDSKTRTSDSKTDSKSESSDGKSETCDLVVKEDKSRIENESVSISTSTQLSDHLLSEDVKSILDGETSEDFVRENKHDSDSKMDICEENPKPVIGDDSELEIKLEDKPITDSLFPIDKRNVTNSQREPSATCFNQLPSVSTSDSSVVACSNSTSEKHKSEPLADLTETNVTPHNVDGCVNDSQMEVSEDIKSESVDSQTESSTTCLNQLPSVVSCSNSTSEEHKLEPLIDLTDANVMHMNVDGCMSDSTETLSHPSEGFSSPEVIVNKKQGVHFLDSKSMDYLNKRLAKREFPKDFAAVKEKLEANLYKTVEEFSEDMVNIIQAALNCEDTVTRKKMNNSVRSTFIKQMEKAFPWFNVNTCMLWEHNRNLPDGMLPDAVLPPTTDHTYAQWLERDEPPISPQPSPFKRCPTNAINRVIVPMASLDDNGPVVNTAEVVAYTQDSDYDGEDTRRCVLCSKLGDDLPDDSGRLLYVGQNDWVHVNCALWSAEVFEEKDGCLQNVHSAITRGKKLLCDFCGKSGATVGCCSRACSGNYHFACARLDHCVFQEDKKVYCRPHGDQAVGGMVHHGGFPVLRRVSVDMDSRSSKKSWSKGITPSLLSILIGSCTIESLGHLEPLSDRSDFLLPVDFVCSRVYWSTKDARRRCIYTCRITEVRPTVTTPEVKIKDMTIIHDETHRDFVPLQSLDLKSLGLSSLVDSSVTGGEKQLDVIFVSQTWNSTSATATTSMISLSTATTSTTSLHGSTALQPVFQSATVEPSVTDVLCISEQPKMYGENLKSLPQISEGFNMNVFSPNTLKSPQNSEGLNMNVLSPNTVKSTQNSEGLNLNVLSPNTVKSPSSMSESFNLNVLSPNTLKCLGSATLSKYTSHNKQTTASDTDFGNLTRMVDRLNNAASRVGGKHRSSSGLVGGKRPASAERTFREITPPLGKLKRSSSCDSPSPWFKPEIMKPSQSFTPSFTPEILKPSQPFTPSLNQKTTDLHATEPIVIESDESNIQQTAALVTEGSTNPPISSSNPDDNEITQDADLVEKVLSSLPSELLEECQGHTVVVVADDADLTEEEMIQLAQSALEAEEITDTIQDQSDLTIPSKDLSLADREEVPVAKEKESHLLDEDAKEISVGTNSSLVEEKQDGGQNSEMKSSAEETDVKNVSSDTKTIVERDMVAKEVSNKNSLAERETVAKELSNKNSLAERETVAKELSNTNSLAERETIAKELSNTNSLAERETVAKEISKTKSLAERETVAKEVPSSPNVPKIVEEILSQDFGTWLSRGASVNISAQTVKENLRESIVQKSGGKDNLLKRHEENKAIKEPEPKRKRMVSKKKTQKHKSGTKDGCGDDQDDESKVENNVKLKQTNLVIGNEERVNEVRSNMGSNSGNKSIENNLSGFNSPDFITEISEPENSTIVESTENSPDVEILPTNRATASASTDSKKPGEIVPTKIGESKELSPDVDSNSQVIVESGVKNVAKRSDSDVGNSLINKVTQKSVSESVTNSKSDYSKTKIVVKSDGCKYKTVEEPVYIRGRMIGYHVVESKVDSNDEIVNTISASSSTDSNDEIVKTSSVSSTDSKKLDDFVPTREVTGEEESSREVTGEKESSLREVIVEKNSSWEVTGEKESSSREVTVEKESSREVTGEKESSSREVIVEKNSSREVTGEKIKPDKEELSNCLEETVTKPNENIESDQTLNESLSNKDVRIKKDKSKKEPLKKYPLRRTIQRVIGDIDMMAELAVSERNHEKNKQKNLSSSVNAGVSNKEKDDIVSDDSVLQEQEKSTSERRTRSKNGKFQSSQVDVKCKHLVDKLKSKDESDINISDQPCLMIEKLNTDVKFTSTDLNSQIDKESKRLNLRMEKMPEIGLNSDYDIPIEKESKLLNLSIEKVADTDKNVNSENDTSLKTEDKKITSRRLSVRLEKLSDTEITSKSERDLTEKESTVKISSRRASLRSERISENQLGHVKQGTDVKLHEKIAEKIKAESIAKSSPGEKGPFKCRTCRRMYRTEESYRIHIKDCNFEVSTSDEEEEELSEEKLRQLKRDSPLDDCYVKLDSMKEKEQEKNESEMKSLESVKDKEMVSEMTKNDLSKVSVSLEILPKRGRGRPPKIKTSKSLNTGGESIQAKDKSGKSLNESECLSPKVKSLELTSKSVNTGEEEPMKAKDKTENSLNESECLTPKVKPPKIKSLELSSTSHNTGEEEPIKAKDKTEKSLHESGCLSPKISSESSNMLNESRSTPQLESEAVVAPITVRKRGRPPKQKLPSEVIPATESADSDVCDKLRASSANSESVCNKLRASSANSESVCDKLRASSANSESVCDRLRASSANSSESVCDRLRASSANSSESVCDRLRASSANSSESVCDRLRGSPRCVQDNPPNDKDETKSKSALSSQKVGGSSDEGREAAAHTKKWVKIRKRKLRKCSVTNWNKETCDKIQSICPKDSVDTSSGKKRYQKRRKKISRTPSQAEKEETSTENQSEDIVVVNVETSPSNSEDEDDKETREINSQKNSETAESNNSQKELSRTKESGKSLKESKSEDKSENKSENKSEEKSRIDMSNDDGKEIERSASSNDDGKEIERSASSNDDGKEIERSASSNDDGKEIERSASSNSDSKEKASRRLSAESPAEICQGLKEKLGRKTPEIMADLASSRRASLEKEVDSSSVGVGNSESLSTPPSPDHPFLDELTGEMVVKIDGNVVPSSDISKQDSTVCEKPIPSSNISKQDSTVCEKPIPSSNISKQDSTVCEKPIPSSNISKEDSTVCEKPEIQRVSPRSLRSVCTRNIFEVISSTTTSCESKKSLKFGSENRTKSSLSMESKEKGQKPTSKIARIVPEVISEGLNSDKSSSPVSESTQFGVSGVKYHSHMDDVTDRHPFCSDSSSQTPRPAKPLTPSPLTIGKEPSHSFITKPLAIRRPVVSGSRKYIRNRAQNTSTPRHDKHNVTEADQDNVEPHHVDVGVQSNHMATHNSNVDVGVQANHVAARNVGVMSPSPTSSLKIVEDLKSPSFNEQSIKIATEILRQKYMEKQKHHSLANHLLNKMARNPSVVPPALLNQCGIQAGTSSDVKIQQDKASIIETALRQLQQINPGLVNTAAQQLGYQSTQVNTLNVPSLHMSCVPNQSSLEIAGVGSQSNVASFQIPGVNSQSNIASLQIAGNSQSNVASLQMPGVNSQSHISSLHMSGVQTIQMSNVGMETNVSHLGIGGHYSAIQSSLPTVNLQNPGILVTQNVGQMSSRDIVYQSQIQTDTNVLQSFTSAFQQIPNTIPTPNIIQPMPGLLQTQQMNPLQSATMMQTPLLCTPSIMQQTLVQQSNHNVIGHPEMLQTASLAQQTASVAQQTNHCVLRHPEMLQTASLSHQTASVAQQTNHGVLGQQTNHSILGHPEMLHTSVPLQSPAFGLSSNSVSYMGSFVLPKVEQRQLGSGEMDQSLMTSGLTNSITDNIMNCLPSPMLHQAGISTSVCSIGMTSAGRPVIKVVLENQDGSDSRLPLPVQDLMKNIGSVSEAATSVKVVCKNSKSEQTIYSSLPAASLIQSISRRTGNIISTTSNTQTSSTSCRSPPRVIKCSLTPSSPNLRNILNKVTVTTHPTVTTSSTGEPQKAVMSRINVIKKLLNKPNILHRKRPGNTIEGMAAKRQALSGDTATPVRYIIKRSNKATEASGSTGCQFVRDESEVPRHIQSVSYKVNEQTGRIEKRKIIQKFSIPGFLEDLLLKQKSGKWGQDISKPDINRALLDLTKSSVPASPSSTSSSQGNIVSVLKNKMAAKKEKVKRPTKKITLLDKSKSCGKKAADYTKLKLGKKGKKTNRRKSPHKVRNMTQSLAVGHISHPLIHHQNEAASLPQPAVEEEVRETPLTLYKENRNPQQQKNLSKDSPRLVFEISSDDGFHCKADSMEEAWKKVLNKTQDSRSAARMKSLSYNGIKGCSMFGVDHHAVIYLLEQLYGASHCHNYCFKYHKHMKIAREEEPALNPTGCIRTEPFTTRKEFDMFSFLMSQYRERPKFDSKQDQTEMTHKSARRTTSLELPMAMRFRKLQEHAKEAVGAYRSNIHGRGLFCKRNIDAGEMVIEYAGEVIRATLTDKREKYYESKGIGCYMFRIDDYDVVDATMHGSAARFINHSCEPNCYSKVINVDGRKHIVIFAMRQILRGEELTYDYKFPIEEVKIPCTCKSMKCRRYLN